MSLAHHLFGRLRHHAQAICGIRSGAIPYSAMLRSGGAIASGFLLFLVFGRPEAAVICAVFTNFLCLVDRADHVVTDGKAFSKVDLPKGLPLSVGFGVFGLVGPTAYFGLLDIGQPKPGETLVVSAASGGVGQIVGQIGKIKGCRVIGIAGGPEKCRFLTEELGFDAAIDYKNEDVGQRLDALAPDGVDINFEQVGGPIMEAVMSRMRTFGRMPLCGTVSGYNDEKPAAGPRTWPLILMRRLTVRGFIVSDFMARFGEMARDLGGWMGEGRIKTRQDVRKGLAHALTYLDLLYTGGNTGKLLVEVSPDAAKL